MSPRRQLPTPAARRALAWRNAASALAVAGPGCAPAVSDVVDVGVVETAHLRITTTTDNPVCAGTGPFLEGELQRIAAALELPLWSEDDKLDVRFGQDAVAEICTSWDPDAVSGCVGGDDGARVVAAAEVAYNASHELVHAVRLENDVWSTLAFEEGLAQILSGSEGFPLYVSYPHGDPVVGPLQLLEIPYEEFILGYYVPSQSFVSWLWEAYGRASLLAFVNDPAFDGADAASGLFEQHFGLPLADADQAWRIDERPDSIWGAPCIPGRTYSLADGAVELSGALDCSDPSVYGASSWMSLWPMCLEVPETTRVRMSFEAEHGRLQVFGREPCDAGPVGAEAYRAKLIEAGDVLEEDIAGCRYRMLLSSPEPGFPPTPYTIRIEEIDG